MKVEVKRTVKKEVEEVVEMKLHPYWTVRVVRIGNYNNKEVIFEKFFDNEPEEQDIADCLIGFSTKKCFASVVKNYMLVEVGE